MELKFLKLQNFLSFKELSHQFINEPVLVQGKNLSEIESKETNGAGKSTMMAGIAYAILATPLRKQTLDRDLITWGEEEAQIWLDIYCPIRKETLNIHRTLRVKGSASLELTINEEPNSVKFATIADGNSYILNWIGISAEDLKNYYIINKENFKSFVSSSNTDKLALISRFIKAETLDDADDIIKEKNKPLESKVREYEANMNRIEGQLSVYNEQLAAERERNLEEERQSRMDAINGKIDSVVARAEKAEEAKQLAEVGINEANKTIHATNHKIEEVNKQLNELEKMDYAKEYEKVNRERKSTDEKVVGLRNQKDDYVKGKSTLEIELKKLNVLLKGTVTCPKCHYEFSTSSNQGVDEINKEIKDKTKKIAKIDEDCEQVAKSLDELAKRVKVFDERVAKIREEEKGVILEIRTVQNQITTLKGEIVRQQQKIKNFEQTIKESDRKIEECNIESENLLEEIERVENEVLQTREEEIEGLIDITNKKLKKAQTEVEKLKEQIADNTQWAARFKEFKMSLACEQLRIIQNFANLALQKQRSELRLSIDGFKRDAKGRVKSEITVTVINGEGEYKSFWSFSGGERARIEVALIQAMQEMINGTNTWGGLHFLTIDEVLEGTDPLGLSLLLESLQGCGYPIYIISHVMNIRAGVNTLTVVKENGYSYIE